MSANCANAFSARKTMQNELDKQIAKVVAQLKQLEAQAEQQRSTENKKHLERIAKWQKEAGLDSPLELIAMIREVTGAKAQRVEITEELKNKAIALFKADSHTVAEVAEQLGISAPSAMKIKKDAGLSKARKPKTVEVKAA
jgi:hypothetical protein